VILGRVVGTVVSTVQLPAYAGRKQLLVQPVRWDGGKLGRAFIAIDSVQAGEGDLVLCAREGNAARQVLGNDDDPLHSVVLGIVDDIMVASAPTSPSPAPESKPRRRGKA
jgi:microcompartment protein CcmK/EutM